MKAKYIRSRQFIKIFLSYLLVLLLGIAIVGTLSFRQIMQKNRDLYAQKQSDDAHRFADQIDRQIDGMVELCEKMRKLYWVQKLTVNAPSVQEEMGPITRLQIVNDFKTYIWGGGFYDSVTVCFPQQDTIVSGLGWSTIDEYFRMIQDERNGGRLQASLDTRHDFEVIYEPGQTIHYAESLWLIHTLDNAKEPGIQIAFTMNKGELSRYLLDLFPDTLSRLTVSDVNGRETLRIGRSSEWEEEPLRTIRLASGSIGWTFGMDFRTNVPVVSSEEFMSLMLALLICCLAGPIAAYLMTVLTYRPVQRILAKLQSSGASIPELPKSATEFSAIEAYVESMSVDNRALKQKLTEFRDYAQKDFLRQLARGYFGGEDFAVKSQSFGLEYNAATRFAVLLLLADLSQFDPTDPVQQSLSLTLYLEERLSETGFGCKLFAYGEDSILVVLSDNGTALSDDKVETLVQERFSGDDAAFLQVFSGRVEAGALGVSKSYQDAKEKSDYGNEAASPVDYSQGIYYYPTDWEVQLINNLKTGQIEPVERILNEMLAENEKRRLSPQMLESLFHTIRGTIRRVAIELNLSDFEPGPHIPPPADPAAAAEGWRRVRESCAALCDRSTSLLSQRSTGNELGGQLTEYVTEHFSDPDISLKLLASRFHVSTSTVSAVFKQTYGLNFSDYVCRRRVESAKELIRGQALSIEEIGRRVGYENEYSFRRVFLRYEGISPSEYRARLKAKV